MPGGNDKLSNLTGFHVLGNLTGCFGFIQHLLVDLGHACYRGSKFGGKGLAQISHFLGKIANGAAAAIIPFCEKSDKIVQYLFKSLQGSQGIVLEDGGQHVQIHGIEKIYHLEAEILLVFKIKIKRSLGDTGCLEYLLNARMIVSFVVDDPGAGLENFILGILFHRVLKRDLFCMSEMDGIIGNQYMGEFNADAGKV